MMTTAMIVGIAAASFGAGGALGIYGTIFCASELRPSLGAGVRAALDRLQVEFARNKVDIPCRETFDALTGPLYKIHRSRNEA